MKEGDEAPTEAEVDSESEEGQDQTDEPVSQPRQVRQEEDDDTTSHSEDSTNEKELTEASLSSGSSSSSGQE